MPPILALLDELRQRTNRSLNRHLGIDARALKDVNRLDAVQQPERLPDRRPDALRAAVRGVRLGVVRPLDAEHDLVGDLKIVVEVILEELQ